MSVSAALTHLPAGRAVCSADAIGQRIAVLKKKAKGDATRMAIGTMPLAVPLSPQRPADDFAGVP